MRDVKRLEIETKEFTPEYGTEDSAGFDVRAYLPKVNSLGLRISKGETVIIPTGIKMNIPVGYEVQLRSRSGLTAKSGIVIGQGVATIDEDYLGEVGVILRNEGIKAFYVTHGMRICQGILAPVTKALFKVVDSIDKPSTRGSGGYGSTGV